MKNIMTIGFPNGHVYNIVSNENMRPLYALSYTAFKDSEFVIQNLDLNELIANLIAVENEIYKKHKELEQDTYKNSTENMEI